MAGFVAYVKRAITAASRGSVSTPLPKHAKARLGRSRAGEVLLIGRLPERSDSILVLLVYQRQARNVTGPAETAVSSAPAPLRENRRPILRRDPRKRAGSRRPPAPHVVFVGVSGHPVPEGDRPPGKPASDDERPAVEDMMALKEDGEVDRSVAVGVTLQEGVAAAELHPQLAGLAGERLGSDELEALVAG